ncbi:MAG: glycosyltransferase [Anaerolineae bacterium]
MDSPPTRWRSGIVGQLVPVRDHCLFVEAASEVRAQRPDARFVIVGDGRGRADIEAQVAALGLTEMMTFAQLDAGGRPGLRRPST